MEEELEFKPRQSDSGDRLTPPLSCTGLDSPLLSLLTGSALPSPGVWPRMGLMWWSAAGSSRTWTGLWQHCRGRG